MSRPLSEKAIADEMTHSVKTVLMESVDSTNSEAKRLLASGLTVPLFLLAQTQTSGRGRLGRAFCSPHGAGLYMSIVLHPDCPPKDVLSITSAAAVAVCEAIEALTPLRPQIKWVNDVYLAGKKVCGILTEGVTDPVSGRLRSVVVGIGINCTASAFPKEIEAVATSLEGEGASVDLNRLAAMVCDRLLVLYEELPRKTWLDAYRSRSWLDGKTVVYRMDGILHEGVVLGIGNAGELILATAHGEVVLSTGEVSVRPKERAMELQAE